MIIIAISIDLDESSTSNSGFSSVAAGFVTSTRPNMIGASNISIISGNGYTQRYSDCCKTSCAWPGKAVVTSPVHSCAQDGITSVDNNTRSVCDNGTAYICDDQQPWNVTGALSYGFSSAYLSVSKNGLGLRGYCSLLLGLQ